MMVGLDYDLSYAPVIKGVFLLLLLRLVAAKGKILYFEDISKSFQSIIFLFEKRHYIHIPSLYMR